MLSVQKFFSGYDGRIKQSRLLTRSGTIALYLAFITTTFAGTTDDTGAWPQGFWKSPPVPRRAQGEFDNQDPYGLSIGVRIKTDCSVYWIYQESNKLYCFNSLTSKSFFIENPLRYIRAAEAFLAQ